MARKKIKDIYYLYHPNAVQDDSEPSGYKLTDGGKWVVEWNIYVGPITYFSEPEHYKMNFKTEEDAKRFYNKLMKRYDEQEKDKLG